MAYDPAVIEVDAQVASVALIVVLGTAALVARSINLQFDAARFVPVMVNSSESENCSTSPCEISSEPIVMSVTDAGKPTLTGAAATGEPLR